MCLFFQQRGREVRDPRVPGRTGSADRRSVQPDRGPPQCLIHHDEGSVRQLRGAEDDRRGRAHAAQNRNA